MNQLNVNNTTIPMPIETPANSNEVTNKVSKLPSAVLKRLMDEVKFDSQNNVLAYNRTHNRHNRGK